MFFLCFFLYFLADPMYTVRSTIGYCHHDALCVSWLQQKHPIK